MIPLAEATQWLIIEVDAGRTDARLPTRFHTWLADRLSSPPAFPASMRVFLAACEQAGIKAKARGADGRFVYGVWRVLPEPQQPHIRGKEDV